MVTDSRISNLIEALHRSPTMCAIVTTGGGANAVAMLLGVPGSSKTVLDAAIPYGQQALVDYLGEMPESFCSSETAERLADRAFDRAWFLAPSVRVVGIACTAALATDRPKKGAHRFYIATRSLDERHHYGLVLEKGKRSRHEEETVLDMVFLNALAEAFGIAERVEVPLLAGEHLEYRSEDVLRSLAELMSGKRCVLAIDTDGRICLDQPKPGLLLAGSFHPLHHGHLRLAKEAAQRTGQSAAFELSITNVDKPPLTMEEARERWQQFVWKAPVWLTRAPTFLDKARLFPRATFVVGADTAVRIVDPRYYEGDARRMQEALAEIRHLGCRFLVAGRRDERGQFRSLDDIPLPETFRDLFEPLPLRVDISSTELRKKHGIS
ncbi:MAG: hypothetical protein KatS3mg105_1966 [Gemmatales bacterium]|nr:MAG: hypothetical protein KatS3mg105_1966 [Gemmatales bacterium]